MILSGITNIIPAVMLDDFFMPGVMFFAAQYNASFFRQLCTPVTFANDGILTPQLKKL